MTGAEVRLRWVGARSFFGPPGPWITDHSVGSAHFTEKRKRADRGVPEAVPAIGCEIHRSPSHPLSAAGGDYEGQVAIEVEQTKKVRGVHFV